MNKLNRGKIYVPKEDRQKEIDLENQILYKKLTKVYRRRSVIVENVIAGEIP